jgi:hypothetical protein
MAEEHKVYGSCEVAFGGNTMGRTDNDGAEIRVVEGAEEVFDAQWGPHVPAAIIHHGRFARVAMTLVKRDASVVNTAAKTGRGGGTTLATLGKIGVDMLTSTNTLIISGTINRFEAPKAILHGDDIVETPIGPRLSRLDLTFTCFPASNSATSPAFTLSSA